MGATEKDGEKSYITVKPAWAAPLSHPNRHLALLDGKGNEIVTLDEPEKELEAASLKAVLDEVAKRYLTATIHKILHAKVEFGATYWHVVTERGERDFVTQSLQENAQWLAEGHLLLIDVDGNRFEILQTSDLDAESRKYIDTIL
jgi:hypothetical protein